MLAARVEKVCHTHYDAGHRSMRITKWFGAMEVWASGLWRYSGVGGVETKRRILSEEGVSMNPLAPKMTESMGSQWVKSIASV